MRFFKFILLFFVGGFFVTPQFVLAGICSAPDKCVVGDICNWPGATEGSFCGEQLFYNRCKVNSKGKAICTALLNSVCDSTKSSSTQCGPKLVCISNKCVEPVTCEKKSLTDMQGTCGSGQVCLTYKCVDAKSPEAAETVKQYNDAKKQFDDSDARTKEVEAALGIKPNSSPNLSFGSGNVTCGNRTFTCTRGGWFSGVSDNCYCCGQCTPDDLLAVGNTILKWLFGIIGAVGLAMFVWGGFKFITSAGASNEVSAGKKIITNAVIGLVMMFSAGSVVILIQDKLGVNQEVRINITNEGPAYVAPTTAKSASGVDESHGKTKIGESCLYQKNTKSSDCGEGLYCYSIDQTKGVCLPKNPEKSVSLGGDCYILPGDKDMCKVGTCQASDKTPGTKGVCPTLEDNQNLGVGDSCKKDSDCTGKKSFFTVSTTCYTKLGKCIPAASRNLGRGESCYVLPGSSLNDCATGLLCVQKLESSDPKKGRTIGELGVCYNYKNQTRGYPCIKDFECSPGDSCKQVPKAESHSYCMKNQLQFDVQENGVCEPNISVYNPNYTVDNCAVGFHCVEVDGVDRCISE